jgi:RHH-type proline utilization regulon transcriptional repressor/proline dehydrogenase/delta 1-pyrroline-5-carboxylate dehydrogenase
MKEEFSRTHDHFCLIGQDNIRRYLPVSELRIRLHREDSAFDLFARVCAAKAAGCRITVSYIPGYTKPALELLETLTEAWGGRIEFVEESSNELVSLIRGKATERLRYASPERPSETVLRAAGDTGVYIARAPVLSEGRIELLWYLKEQSISFDYHRYGNLGDRAQEQRAPTL